TDSAPDGTSTTVVVGEKAIPAAAYATWTCYWDEPFFVGGSGGTTRGVPTQSPNANLGTPFYSQTQIVPNQVTFPALPFYYSLGSLASVLVGDNDPNLITTAFANIFGSPHPGGVNF